MTDYNVPPEALGDIDDDDDMVTQEIPIEDVRRYLADTKPQSIYLDKHGLPRRAVDRNDPHLMEATKSVGKLIGVSHLLSKMIKGEPTPTSIRATGGDMSDPKDSLDITRTYNPTSAKPEIKVDIDQPRQPKTRWEKLRSTDQKSSLERRREVDPEAEASQAKTIEEKRTKKWWE